MLAQQQPQQQQASQPPRITELGGQQAQPVPAPKAVPAGEALVAAAPPGAAAAAGVTVGTSAEGLSTEGRGEGMEGELLGRKQDGPSGEPGAVATAAAAGAAADEQSAEESIHTEAAAPSPKARTAPPSVPGVGDDARQQVSPARREQQVASGQCAAPAHTTEQQVAATDRKHQDAPACTEQQQRAVEPAGGEPAGSPTTQRADPAAEAGTAASPAAISSEQEQRQPNQQRGSRPRAGWTAQAAASGGQGQQAMKRKPQEVAVLAAGAPVLPPAGPVARPGGQGHAQQQPKKKQKLGAGVGGGKAGPSRHPQPGLPAPADGELTLTARKSVNGVLTARKSVQVVTARKSPQRSGDLPLQQQQGQQEQQQVGSRLGQGQRPPQQQQQQPGQVNKARKNCNRPLAVGGAPPGGAVNEGARPKSKRRSPSDTPAVELPVIKPGKDYVWEEGGPCCLCHPACDCDWEGLCVEGRWALLPVIVIGTWKGSYMWKEREPSASVWDLPPCGLAHC